MKLLIAEQHTLKLRAAAGYYRQQYSLTIAQCILKIYKYHG